VVQLPDNEAVGAFVRGIASLLQEEDEFSEATVGKLV